MSHSLEVGMAARTGGELIQDFLGTYEIPYIFGNPGTTETTFLAAISASNATYVLSLHESSAVGIAAGYALITGKPSIVSLHTYPGLANGMFNMRKRSWPACRCSSSTDSKTRIF
jgi:benzoylformate decarboxylase